MNSELAQWAGYHGLSSYSVMNNTKTDLVDAGLLETEKQSGHVGRPRQLLALGSDVADLSRAELLERV